MKNLLQIFIVLFASAFLFSCASDDSLAGESSFDSSLSGAASIRSGSSSGTGAPSTAGVITAGEWNDLENWDFWQSSIVPNYISFVNQWEFYPQHKVAVKLSSINDVEDIPIELLNNGMVVWRARTNNEGKAVLWANLFINSPLISTQLSLNINNGQQVVNGSDISLVDLNKINYSGMNQINPNVDIAFVVDATGSMGDEIQYLKVELQDVLQRVQSQNVQMNINTAAIFYRDEGDEYVTKSSPFTNDFSMTTSFIQQQSAGGGGDYPEAVHTALDEAVNTLSWSNDTKAKILFLLLDAPPHDNSIVKRNIQDQVKKAAEKGITIIPISASGINDETEFLLRAMAIATNGTYVFITDDSGIGNDHLEAKVGNFDVEYLNDLMVRLIDEALM